jgi:hypothetical protein
MATLIGKKPLSNAERQRRFRQKKNAAGLTRRETWTGLYGFLAPPSKSGGYATMSFKELKQELSKLLLNCNDWECEMVYAEIFEYAKKIMPNFIEVFEDMRKILKDSQKK